MIISAFLSDGTRHCFFHKRLLHLLPLPGFKPLPRVWLQRQNIQWVSEHKRDACHKEHELRYQLMEREIAAGVIYRSLHYIFHARQAAQSHHQSAAPHIWFRSAPHPATCCAPRCFGTWWDYRTEQATEGGTAKEQEKQDSSTSSHYTTPSPLSPKSRVQEVLLCLDDKFIHIRRVTGQRAILHPWLHNKDKLAETFPLQAYKPWEECKCQHHLPSHLTIFLWAAAESKSNWGSMRTMPTCKVRSPCWNGSEQEAVGTSEPTALWGMNWNEKRRII